MDLFHEIQDGLIVLQSKGVYKQGTLFRRGSQIYAKWGSGFISLREMSKGTSIPTVFWVDIEIPQGYTFDELGRMIVRNR